MSFLRKIVRNDAVKLDPPEVYNWRVFGLAAAVGAATKQGHPRADTI
jgi:hypothetical protein